MALIQATISSPVAVDGQPLVPTSGGLGVATISPPAPWTVAGQVNPQSGHPVLIMTYQVGDGSLISFLPPPGAAMASPVASQFSFSLTGTDIPANGTYLVTIVAWDQSGAGAQFQFNVNAVNFVTQMLIPGTTTVQPTAPQGGISP